MSQKKVEDYKSRKSQREKIAKKEKLMNFLEGLVWSLIAVAIVGWIGFSVYDKVTVKPDTAAVEEEEVVMDFTSLDEYISDLNKSAE